MGARDTCDVGPIKGIGRIYQQTFIDTCTKVGFAKLHTSKYAITAANLLNDRTGFCPGMKSTRSAYCGS